MPQFPRTVRRRILGTLAILATALALMTAAAAVPARADDRDLARALAAAAVLALIAATVDDADSKEYRYDRRDRRRMYLPAQCAVDLRQRRGGVVYAAPCLRQYGVDGPLPRSCAANVRIRGRHVTVFPEACLIGAGFRPPRW
jgi:hypothetical protein